MPRNGFSLFYSLSLTKKPKLHAAIIHCKLGYQNKSQKGEKAIGEELRDHRAKKVVEHNQFYFFAFRETNAEWIKKGF